jgi:redox-sensitive bicupin YhaK (pirin superfamily)
MSIRPIVETRAAQPTMEGAGVHLHRAFGFQDPTELDPFLLFDDFRNDDPAFYRQGLPVAPASGDRDDHLCAGGHGGTFRQPRQHGQAGRGLGPVDDGGVRHPASGDAAGNAKGQMHGFQLWGNLPGSMKMTAPRYQDIQGAEIPEVTDDDGTHVRVITGEFWGKKRPRGRDRRRSAIPRRDGARRACGRRSGSTPTAAPSPMSSRARVRFRTPRRRRACLLEKEVMGQEVNIRDMSGDRTLIRFGTGDEVTVQAGPEGVRFLLISGAPIEEPVAWHGPIVMNTQAELRDGRSGNGRSCLALNGTFIKPAH